MNKELNIFEAALLSYSDARKGLLLNSILFTAILFYECSTLITNWHTLSILYILLRSPIILILLPALTYFGIYKSLSNINTLRKFTAHSDITSDKLETRLLLSEQLLQIDRILPQILDLPIGKYSFKLKSIVSGADTYYMPLSVTKR